VTLEATATTAKAPATAEAVRARGLPVRWAAGSLLFLAASLLVGLGIGPVHIGPIPILESGLSHVPLLDVHSHLSAVEGAIVWQLRAPRVVLGALVGGMLAVAGSAYQGVFRNPLADPYLLGVAAGAGLGATLAIAFASAQKGSGLLLPLAAFGGATIGVAFAYVLGRSVGGASSTGTLVLAGVTVAAFMTALQTFVQQERTQTLQEVYAWLLGGLETATWHDVALCSPYIAVSSLAIVLHRRLLDVLSLGDDEAASLGVDVRRVRLVIVAAATLGTSAAVAVSGLIGFIGIIVPHTIRLLVTTSYRAVVPLSLIVGAGFLVLTDVLARTILAPSEVPIGVVTAFFGAPFFAVVLRRTRAVGM
jgi:iron complex transport system permease protein